MTGTLGLFSLVDLFQLLSSSSRSGRLVVAHPKGRARVYFDKGRVVCADFGDLKGEEAIYALFGDERGRFEFKLGMPAPEVNLEGSTENLVLEAIRRLDEARRDPKNSLANEAVPTFTDAVPDAGHLTLHSHEVQVLRLVDGQRDIQRIAAETGIELERVKEIIARLVRVSALAVRGRKPRVARLVTQLARDSLPPGTVGIDAGILASWEHALGRVPAQVACRRPNGTVDVFWVEEVHAAGPYILLSRDTLFAANLAANTALLVKPAGGKGA